MQENLRELLDLFLEEASGRLERLALAAPVIAGDADAALTAQRELHALKGAARMMGLSDIAEACHRAEELAGRGGNAPDPKRLVDAVDELTRLVARLQSETGPGEEAKTSCAPERGTEHMGPEGVLRAPRSTMDRVTDLSTRIRIISRGLTQRVRDLQHLVLLAEQGVTEEHPEQVLAALAAALRNACGLVDTAQVHLWRDSSEQVALLLSVQMQPLEPTFLELARHARELARELGKETDVEIQGVDVLLDRRMTSALFESLVHLVRNCVDHGIETSAERTDAGKNARGLVVIRASQHGDRVTVTVRDDGRGLDREAVLEAARQRGLLVSELADLPVEEMVFLPGLSTRSKVSEVSGRGIGMDAVAAAVRSVGGEIRISSERGRGTTMTLDVPAARRGRRVVVISVHDLLFAIPLSRVQAYYAWDDVSLEQQEGEDWVSGRVGDRVYPVVFMDDPGVFQGTPGLFLEVQGGDRRFLVAAGAVRAVEEVLTHTLPSKARSGTLFEEAGVLSTGEAVPVLILGESTTVAGAPGSARATMMQVRRLRILLVDDSPVTREMERRLLEDAGLFVEAVSDASSALARLGQAKFDCLVTDIEMPGMDGLELTRTVRRSENLSSLPIVVVSTRSLPEHRLAGLEAGADAYVAKQEMQPGELGALIFRLAGEAS